MGPRNQSSAPKPPSEGARSNSARTVYSDRLREDILTLRNRGLVPLAIADILDVRDSTVRDHIRRLVRDGVLSAPPRFLEKSGPLRELVCCRHCGKVQ